MANPLKNLDFKQFFIDHGEKVGLGVIALLGLWLLAKADWKVETRSPTELAQAVEEGRTKLQNSQWQEKEQYVKNEPTIIERVETLIAEATRPVEIDQYALRTPIHPPIIDPASKVKPMPVLPVEDLLTHVGTIHFIMKDRPSEFAVAQAPTDDQKKDGGQKPPELPGADIFAPRTGNNNRTGTGGPLGTGGTGVGQPTGAGTVGGHDGGDAYQPPAPGENEGDALGGGHGGGDPLGTSSGESTPKADVPSRGAVFVSVVGIYNLREQLKQLAISMGENPLSMLDQKDRIVLWDFRIQRQAIPEGTPQFPEDESAWEDVDINDAMSFLALAEDYDSPVNDPAVIDPVITMPLIRRTYGLWTAGDIATHPRIKDFQLSEEERKKIDELNQQYLEKYREKVKKGEVKPPPRRGGFAQAQTPIQAARNAAFKDGTPDIKAPGIDENTIKREKDKVTASGNLLLFRFFDFSAKPGMVYRYRVKLKIFNPHYGLTRDEAELAAIEKQFLESQWSQPSRPIHVPPTTYYFVEDADDPKARFPFARTVVYHFHPKYGTIVRAVLRNEVGSIMGGEAKAVDVIDPAAETYEKKTVNFETDDLLVDLDPYPELTPEDHPELGLPVNQLKRRESLAIFNRVLIADVVDHFRLLDPIANLEDRLHQRRIKELQDRVLGEAFKKKDDKGDALAPGDEGDHGGGGAGRRGRGRGRNPLAPGAGGEPY